MIYIYIYIYRCGTIILGYSIVDLISTGHGHPAASRILHNVRPIRMAILVVLFAYNSIISKIISSEIIRMISSIISNIISSKIIRVANSNLDIRMNKQHLQTIRR